MAATLAAAEFWTGPLEARQAETLAVLAPTSTEFNVVARRLAPTRGRIPEAFQAGRRTKLGRLGAFEVCLIQSGVGQSATMRSCLQVLPRPFGHALLIGFAGGLEDGLPAGTLVRPARVAGPAQVEFAASNRLSALGGLRPGCTGSSRPRGSADTRATATVP